MQLVAYGAQDIYLTGNPQITFFKVVYRRHTNFAIEAIEQTSTIRGRKASCSKYVDIFEFIQFVFHCEILLPPQ